MRILPGSIVSLEMNLKAPKINAPSSRKCTSGSRTRFFTILDSISGSRCVPDRRGVGALSCGHGNFLGHFDAEIFRIVGGPAGCRDLDDAAVVKRALRRIEVRISPYGDKL